MKELIDWLMKVENTAFELYEKAVEIYKDDREFHEILQRLSDDEALHYHVMASARLHLDNISLKPSLISLDNKTRLKIEQTLVNMLELISNKNTTREVLIRAIVETETSEWNDIFLFVVNSLKEQVKEFRMVAVKTQNHINYIKQFIELTPNGTEHTEKMDTLESVWKEKILIVDDDKAVSELLEAILLETGDITIANNGMEGLERLEQEYYKLIISDIDMPVVNGIDFLKNAVEKFPNVKDRFLFFSGGLNKERITFLKKNNLHYMEKPTSLEEISQNARDILSED